MCSVYVCICDARKEDGKTGVPSKVHVNIIINSMQPKKGPRDKLLSTCNYQLLGQPPPPMLCFSFPFSSSLLPTHSFSFNLHPTLNPPQDTKKANSAQQNQNDTITSQEHLRDKPVAVDGPASGPVCLPRVLCPHLLDVLKYHVAMPVKGLHAREQLVVIAK